MTVPDPKAVIDALTNQEIADVRRSADEGPLNCEGCGAVCLCSQIMMACDELIAAKSALSAETAANAMLREALEHIRDMKPSELAPETFPGLVHGPQLLLDNCQRAARKALSASPSSLTARVMALEAVAVAAQEVDADLGPPLSPDSDRVTMALDGLRKLRSALAALTPSAPADK